MSTPSIVLADPDCETGRIHDNVQRVIGLYHDAQPGVRFEALEARVEFQPPGSIAQYSYLRLQGEKGFATIGYDYRYNRIYWNFADDDGRLEYFGSDQAPTQGFHTLKVKAKVFDTFQQSMEMKWWVDGVLVGHFDVYDDFGAEGWVPTKSQIWTSTSTYRAQVPGGIYDPANFTALSYTTQYGTAAYGGNVRNDFPSTQAQLRVVSSSAYNIKDMKCEW